MGGLCSPCGEVELDVFIVLKLLMAAEISSVEVFWISSYRSIARRARYFISVCFCFNRNLDNSFIAFPAIQQFSTVSIKTLIYYCAYFNSSSSSWKITFFLKSNPKQKVSALLMQSTSAFIGLSMISPLTIADCRLVQICG